MKIKLQWEDDGCLCPDSQDDDTGHCMYCGGWIHYRENQ